MDDKAYLLLILDDLTTGHTTEAAKKVKKLRDLWYPAPPVEEAPETTGAAPEAAPSKSTGF